MIQEGSYVLRPGKPGDRGASHYINIPKDLPPDFVLEYNGTQIGAAHGGVCCIRHIEIFADHNKGHGTKFIELWEAYAKDKCKVLEVSPVTVLNLAHILEHKCGFRLEQEDEGGAKTYVKDC